MGIKCERKYIKVAETVETVTPKTTMGMGIGNTIRLGIELHLCIVTSWAFVHIAHVCPFVILFKVTLNAENQIRQYKKQ